MASSTCQATLMKEELLEMLKNTLTMTNIAGMPYDSDEEGHNNNDSWSWIFIKIFS